MLVVANVSNTFIMYLRVKAVFAESKPAVGVFTLLWIACIVGYFVSAFAPSHTSFGEFAQGIGSQPCTFTPPSGQSLLVGTIALTINDTCVFFAVTYRLLASHMFATHPSIASFLKGFIKGEGLGALPRTLLQTGQLYYL